MPQARGVDVALALYEEATYATEPGSPVGKKLYPTKYNVVPKQNLLDSNTLNAERSRSEPSRGNIDVDGTFSCEVAAEWMGTLLKHALGEVDTTGAGPYEHVITIGNLPVGLTLEKDNGPNISGAGRFERQNGCKVAKVDFNFPTEGYITADFAFKGSKFVTPLPSAALDATPDDPGHSPFTSFEITLLEEGGVAVATIKEAKLSLDNGLDDSIYVIGGLGTRRALPEGFTTLTGSVTGLFEDATLIAKAIAGTETSLLIRASRGTGDGSAGNESIEWLIQQMKYELAGVPVEGPLGLLVPLNFKGYRKTTDRGLQITLKNAVATI